MDMPSRTEIRTWLIKDQITGKVDRAEINKKLALILAEHGPENEQDVRDFLNAEVDATKPKHVDGQIVGGKSLFPMPTDRHMSPVSGEMDLHEQRKADIQADLASRQKLYGGLS